jgi:hypothetical protein
MAGLRFDYSDFNRKLSLIEQRQLFAIETYGKVAGNKMVAYAKRSHPWTNRTYMAQNTITTSQGWNGHLYQIRLHGNMYYDVYLEFKVFRHKGRLSIWFPTVRKFTPEVIQAWADRMKGV